MSKVFATTLRGDREKISENRGEKNSSFLVPPRRYSGIKSSMLKHRAAKIHIDYVSQRVK